MVMASRTVIPSASFSLLLSRGGQTTTTTTITIHYHHLFDELRISKWPKSINSSSSNNLPRQQRRVYATGGAADSESGGKQRAPPVDTRIHWENDEDGWIGGGGNSNFTQDMREEEHTHNLLGEKFSELLNNATDSHYQFLGVSAEADLEEIKSAYRRLSKEYHPDTTSLPLKAASEMFMKLREVYDVLSDEEKRRFYDWTLAQEAASREAEKLRVKLEDPYMQEIQNWQSIPDMVDRLGGRNMELSDQAKSALTFDIFIIIFAICCIVYVVFLKEPYY